VGASLLDRDVDEADRVLAELTELSRAARKAGREGSIGRPPDRGSS
jgi:hypothetical protein